jgi:sugar O-acyltransferase (sialic acid O-acetyltransferase NeuD family)
MTTTGGIQPSFVVFGAGGHGMVVCDTLRAGGHRVIGFVDSDPAKQGADVLGVRVFAALDDLPTPRELRIALGIGHNENRRRVFEELLRAGLHVVTVIHPSAVVSEYAVLGTGSVVMGNVVVNVAARVGDNVILNTGCTIDHHCEIGAHSHIAPGATLAGTVQIGAGTLVGAGAVVIPGIRIGSGCTVAAGATVIRDVPDITVVGGVPARVLHE